MNPLLKKLYDASPILIQEWLLTAFSSRTNSQRYGGRFPEFRALLEQSQWWDAARMRAWQEERLREVLTHAYENVPYYRETFRNCGYDPARFAGLEDLRKLPVLDRSISSSRAELTSAPPCRLPTPPDARPIGSLARYDLGSIAMNYGYGPPLRGGLRLGRRRSHRLLRAM